MLLTLNITDIDITNLIFNKSTNNNIIKDSRFIKIIYSNKFFSLNSIIIDINFLYSNKINKYNKSFYNFDSSKNITTISKLIDLENQIINLFINKNCVPIYNLKNYFLSKNYFSILNKNILNNVYLKISGIWKTESNYGLIFKFI